MALSAKKVSLSVVVVILLLLFSAASFSFFFAIGPFTRFPLRGAASFSALDPRSMGYVGIIQSPTRDDREDNGLWKSQLSFERPRGKYQTYSVLLREHPDHGEAMDDDKDARRRWYESFLPSTPTDSGEPRLLECYPFDDNGFLATLTRAEALALANKPGVVRRMMSSEFYGPFIYSPASCGFVTAITKRSFVRSRPAF